eukprot:CAMPEP_0119281640 /NCGR_PEP_ID=MMETSP1329-20130426/25139_1 /TAXON_ID=114041 /ORGANISM="Genus nov. species nov., Strain RCC1024" /LENGTH=328 /DNA_ID=CAMNT_0007282267 /DNA_START=99 /DNA_END=1082 /DNA_ORIENTATION=+
MRTITACLAALSATAFLRTPPQRVARVLRSTQVSSDWEDDLREAIRIAEAREAFEARNKQSITRRKRTYLSYDRARAWASGLGFSSEADWKEWLALGEGKNVYIPSDPREYYRTRGWRGWGHFLGVEAEGEPEDEPEVLDRAYFEGMDYDAGGVPWDLRGRAQPAVRHAQERGDFGAKTDVILDCGCGAGDNANWLASRGHKVLGFDLCSNAVDQARRRSAEAGDAIARAGGEATFETASCVDLVASPVYQAACELEGFNVALDSALLHCLGDEDQRLYVRELARCMRVGGRLYVGCFSDLNPDPWENPRRLSAAHIRGLFSGPAWSV